MRQEANPCSFEGLSHWILVGVIIIQRRVVTSRILSNTLLMFTGLLLILGSIKGNSWLLVLRVSQGVCRWIWSTLKRSWSRWKLMIWLSVLCNLFQMPPWHLVQKYQVLLLNCQVSLGQWVGCTASKEWSCASWRCGSCDPFWGLWWWKLLDGLATSASITCWCARRVACKACKLWSSGLGVSHCCTCSWIRWISIAFAHSWRKVRPCSSER